MEILFWILAVVSILVGFFTSVVCWFSNGLGLSGSGIGAVVTFLGMLALGVCIVGVVLGIIKLRKGKTKKAVAFALMGLAYSAVIIAGIYIDDAVHTVRLEKDIAERNEQMYGENWDAAPAIEGLPELYQEVLNKFYVAVQNKWPADELMELSATKMPDYYGDASLDNIGFLLMDVNGDGIKELLVGTAAPTEEGGTAIFCLYSDPENPFVNLHGMEGETYYLHPGEGDTYVAEIGGADAAWQLEPEEGTNLVEIIYQEGAMDPAGRLTLEMIPFSQYK